MRENTRIDRSLKEAGSMYDMIIIGAGPAGIAAAVYGKSRGKDVLVLEKNKVGGLVGKVSTVTHYPAIVEGETGETFARRLLEQAEGAGVPIRIEEVLSADLVPEIKTVKTGKGTYEAKTVVLANGGSPKMLGIPGEDLKGVRLNAPKDGKDYAGKEVFVIGGADGAVKEALYLADLARKVTIVCVEDELACIPEFKEKVDHKDNIEIMPHSSLKAVSGKDGKADTFEFIDNKTKETTVITDPEAGVFVYAGIVPNTEQYGQLELDPAGFIVVNEDMETSVPGVFAAGDIRSKKVRQVATAVSDGAIAGINAALKAGK